MTAEPRMPSVAMVEIDHETWIECPVCRALNLAGDRECFICRHRLVHKL